MFVSPGLGSELVLIPRVYGLRIWGYTVSPFLAGLRITRASGLWVVFDDKQGVIMG